MAEDRDLAEGGAGAGTVVRTERRGDVAAVVLDRQDRYNAFDGPMLEQMLAAFRAVGEDPSVRAVILTGAGKAFCTGGDLKAVLAPGRSPGGWFNLYAVTYHQCILELRTMPKPVIAAINGPAAGGGFSLALACDLRIMAEDAFLQQAYTSNGLTMDGGGTFTLPRLVGLAKALEIALLDERIGAKEAFRLGLVTRVVRTDRLMEEAWAMAESLSRKAVGTLGRMKRLFNSSFDTSLETRLEQERASLAASADAPEGREGLSAFSEKRKPDFKGAVERARAEPAA